MSHNKEIEKRIFQIQYRVADESTEPGESKAESRTVEGYAALFNVTADIGGWFEERIEPGAFKEALKRSDIRALFNHDPNFILGRSTAGTLEVKEDEKGLHYRFEAPDTTFGNDFLKMLRRGDISQSSFAFTVAKQRWEEKKMEGDEWNYTRVIEEVDEIYDVSPVTYPAYSETTVSARSKAGEHQKNIFNRNKADELERDLQLLKML